MSLSKPRAVPPRHQTQLPAPEEQPTTRHVLQYQNMV